MNKFITDSNILLSYGGELLTLGSLYAQISYSASHGVVTGPTNVLIGSTVTVTATPDTNYSLSYILVNGQVIAGNSFIADDSNITVKAVFDQAGELTVGNIIWAKTNLAVTDNGTGIIKVNNVSANGVNFGTQYYYNQEAMQRLPSSGTGWRLPTIEEARALVAFVGVMAGKKLKSTSGWKDDGNGTDEYGMNILPVGVYSTENEPTLASIGIGTAFWTSTKINVGQHGLMYAYFDLTYDNTDVTFSAIDFRWFHVSIRLVKDV